MTTARIRLGGTAAAVLLSFNGGPAPAASMDVTGPHGFDFEFGHWTVHHTLIRPDGSKTEFEGESDDRPIMGGAANVEDNLFHRPDGVDTRGVALRAYDAKLDQWAIWWVDSRDPLASLEPAMKGRFSGGVGTFYSDQVTDGKPSRTRFIWSHITPNSARWEQALSGDRGRTWQTNWIMEFRRAGR